MRQHVFSRFFVFKFLETTVKQTQFFGTFFSVILNRKDGLLTDIDNKSSANEF